MQATYSPDDNKLRLYADGKLEQATYERVKAAGFRWAPKQKLFVAPAWTPGREDLPAGSFSEQGTDVNVAMLVIERPAVAGPTSFTLSGSSGRQAKLFS